MLSRRNSLGLMMGLLVLAGFLFLVEVSNNGFADGILIIYFLGIAGAVLIINNDLY